MFVQLICRLNVVIAHYYNLTWLDFIVMDLPSVLIILVAGQTIIDLTY